MAISKREIAAALRAWTKASVYLTPDGLERLEKKLARLKDSLPHLISEAERTAAYGDRSENAEYKDAKATLRRTYRQISAIEDQMKRVQVITSGADGEGKVQPGSIVILETSAGTQKTIEIVGSQETDPVRGRVSHQSPFGAALIGRRAGENVEIKTPGGVRMYTIIEIR